MMLMTLKKRIEASMMEGYVDNSLGSFCYVAEPIRTPAGDIYLSCWEDTVEAEVWTPTGREHPLLEAWVADIIRPWMDNVKAVAKAAVYADYVEGQRSEHAYALRKEHAA